MDGRPIFRDLLGRHTERVSPLNHAALEDAYAHAREEAADFLASQVEPRDPELAVLLREQFEEVVNKDRRARGAPLPVDDEHEPIPSGRGVLFGILCGIGFSVLAAGAVWTAGYWPGGAVLTQGEQRLLEEHRKMLPALADARNFLNSAAKEVRRMIADSDPALVEAESKFLSLSTVMPELEEGKPESLKSYKTVIRADGADYKILLPGVLCNHALADAPDLVDPRRASACTHIGVWTPGGGEW